MYDYDKLVAESTGLYRQWWIMWKENHPEWGIQKEGCHPESCVMVHSKQEGMASLWLTIHLIKL
jgi:hypothetical protein